MGKQSWLKFLPVSALILWSYAAFPQGSQPAAGWMEKVIAIENSGDLPKAKIDKLKSLKASYEHSINKSDSVYARIIQRLGDSHCQARQYAKGINYIREAIAINRNNHPGAQKAFLAHSYLNLGIIYDWLNLLEESRQYFDSCIAIGMRFPVKRHLALRALEQKAFSFFKTGDFQRSSEISDYGLLLAKDLQNSEYEARLYLQKAQSHLELNQLTEAEKNVQQAIRILSGSNMPAEDLALGYSAYASFLKRKNKLEASARYFRKAYELNLQQNNLDQSIRDLSDLGLLYDKYLNDPVKALACYTKSRQLIYRTKDAYQLALVHNNMGVVFWRQKHYRKALYYFHKGLTGLPIGFTDTLLQSNPAPAQLKLVTNDYITSILLANKGESLLALAKEKHNKKYLSFALGTFKAADKAIDQMRWKQSSAQSKLFWRERTKKMYENAIETCYLLGDIDNAFYFFEKSRAVLLNDKLSELGAQQYLSETDQRQEQQLRIRLFSLQQQLASLAESSPQYKQVRLQWLATQESFERFIKNLENSSPTYYRYKYDRTTFTIADVRSRLLGKHQSFIEYFIGDNRLYTLVIQPDTATLSQTDGKNYGIMAKELLRLGADRSLLNQNYSRYRHLALDFYERYFRPLAIRTNRVIISADDYMLPFETLLTNRTDPSSFLLKDHAFSYTYSAGFLLKHTRRQAPEAGATLLGIAPIQYQSYLGQQPLPGADESLQTIKSYFPAASFLVRETATKKEFLESLPLHAVVHLYSHAEADSLGKEPVLYLQDSTLRLSELQLLGRLPTRLIVLSACNTATGRNVRGEGVFSLARGFAAAGIPASITTLWQVDNQPTYQLAELFYKFLSQGFTTDRALQQAKLEFLHTHDKAYELPYFWAAIVLIGNSEKFPPGNTFPPTKVVYLVAGAILFLLFIFAFLLYRKKRRLKLAGS